MALWTDYVQKESLEDEDTLLVYDSTERDNKQVTLANLHNYEKEKLESTQFALKTKEKTLPLAINELKDGSDLTDENVKKMVEGMLIVGDAKKVNGHTVESDVPENAVFTDTVYDDTKVREDIGQLKEDKADKTALVKTDRKLDALWKLNQGISYEFQKDEAVTYQKNIPTGAKLASVEKIGGRTIVWNQLADNSRVNDWGETFIANKHYNKIENHMLYFRHKIKVKSVIKEQDINTKKIIVLATTTKIIGNVDIKKDELKAGYENIVSAIEKMPKDITDISVYNCGNDEVGNTAECEVSVIAVDLTQMFGSGNEPSTPEEFEAMFPADYYPYNEGELLSMGVNDVVEAPYLRNLYNYNDMQKYGFAVFDVMGGEILYRSSTLGVLSEWKIYDQQWKYIGSFDTLLFQASKPLKLPDNARHIVSKDDNVSNTRTYVGYNSDTSYVPYGENDKSYNIPQSILQLDGYGDSAGSVYNYVDFENKKYHKRVGRVDLGTVDYYKDGITYRTSIMDMKIVPKDTAFNGLCVKFIPISFSSNWDTTGTASQDDDNRLVLIDASIESIESFKQAMSGVILCYELSEEQITDISDLIGDTLQEPIEVEDGGSLTFQNTHGANYRVHVPNTVEYTVKLSEVAK